MAIGNNWRHGHSSGGETSPTYRSWSNMVGRCTQPSSPGYAYYTARGITVCDRWRNFKNFLEDMGERPSSGHSIDRYPDNNGIYEPGNVRWATKLEQANNRITNILVTYKGITASFADTCRRLSLKKETIRCRLRLGWPLEQALETPCQDGKRHYRP